MKCKTLLLSIFVCFSILLSAQTTSVSGKVTDERGEAMTGVTVSVAGTTTATATDAEGKFTLDVPADTKNLHFKYIGYGERDVSVADITKKAGFALKLTPADVGLNQIVVSASKKREKLLDAPASISVISGERLTNKVVTTAVDYLKGTPGVDVMQTGLVSNNLVVRGFNNIFSGSVLNVVDNRIGSVPSLRVNTYQLVPTSNLDIDRIEVLRGPASALYGPNASSGVVHIMTKNPLEQEKKFETTIAFNSGFIAQGSNTNGLDAHTQSVGADHINYSIINPEFRHSGKVANGKFGYKISGSYFQGQDYLNYDPREPNPGDSLIFGSVKNGLTFQPDTLSKRTFKSPSSGNDTTVVQYDIRRFNRNFDIRKWSADGRIDYKPIDDLTITLSGGIAQTTNIELTGLGAGQTNGWIYWYLQTRLKWKNLFFQYFVNASDAGNNTYLIPQLTPFSRQPSTYNSPYEVQKLIDKSKLHVFQLQHSVQPHKTVGLIYGVDALLTFPQTNGTINGRFDGHDNVYQAGAYIQAEYDPLKWLKLVGAARIDYNSIINNVAFSPRVAVVFKPKNGQNIRITFNRAFDAPTSLEQFLDLANGQIPNGINVRGIGNPYGYKYSYDAQGKIQFITAPYSGGPGQWVTFGDQTNNYQYLDSAIKLVSAGLAKQSGTDPVLVNALIAGVFDGITGSNGLIQQTKQQLIDYAALAQQKKIVNFQPTDFKNLKRIDNETTQTLELGYKGLFFNKLQVSVDAYWTRKENYVGALTSASGAVIFDLVHDQQLVDRLKANAEPYYSFLKALDNQPAYTNNNIVKSDSGHVYDEILVLLSQLPMGVVTPKDGKINSDYILTYQNLGTLDLFGLDLGLQYQATKDVYIGGSFSLVDKDHITISTGQIAWLNAPKYKASLSLDHVISKVGFGYGASWRWQDSYTANSAVYSGTVSASNIFDARISYRPNFYKGLLFAVNVNNLLNYKWQSFPGTAHMGTTFMWKVQVTF
ncbi:MAG: TonB-dependent receptor [Bacteroidetes bacterium]|nr:TonB-dependent receptor [Bacteroidota bacterium]